MREQQPASPRATVAAVIAAGMGARLRSTSGSPVVKPITPARGVPLIVRTLRTLREEGVSRAVVVTGYEALRLVEVLMEDGRLDGLELAFAHNPEWKLGNGLSVLAARPLLAGCPRFYLSMADHVYPPELLRAVAAAPPGEGELTLAVDRRLETVADLEDATRVRLGDDGRIADIGKGLSPFDAVDTGVFLATPGLFEALEAERRRRLGDCTLSDGVRRLARQGLARAAEIGGAWWQDVDTLADLAALERKLEQAEASGVKRAV